MPIVSRLQQLVDLIPDGTSINKAELVPMLKKGGVKDEEIKYSDFQYFLPDDKKKFSKEEIQNAVADRKDNFYDTDFNAVVDPQYTEYTTIPNHPDTGFTNVQSYFGSAQPERRIESHFPE